MQAVFVELPAFERYRSDYLDDESYRHLQQTLMVYPLAGDVIQGCGGLRKLRFADERRGKGKRGGIRIIYYWKVSEHEFWLFTIYDKDEMTDLTISQRRMLAEMLAHEIKARGQHEA